MAIRNFIDSLHGAAPAPANSYRLRIRGSHMSPVLRDGWFVVIQPTDIPVVGEYVSIELQTGETIIRELHDQREAAIVVGEVNGPRRTSISTSDIKHVHAITGIMPPSQWVQLNATSKESA
jgi:phage repressor protein C with HTH and peptisase S24 domain